MAETTITEIKQAAEQKMGKTLEALRNDLAKVRTGRAHTGILDHVMVDYYGSPTAVPQVANVSLVDSRTLACSRTKKTWSARSRRRFAMAISASTRPRTATSSACRCRR
jgi:ribosome recycling factor